MKLRSKANDRSISLENSPNLGEKGNDSNTGRKLGNHKRKLGDNLNTKVMDRFSKKMPMCKLTLSKREMSSVKKRGSRGKNYAHKSDTSLEIVQTPKKEVLENDATCNVKTSGRIITPKSSPIAVTLTPHRSKKTPRKSPMNLASPKTHTNTFTRVSKTPRKLSLHVKSQIAINLSDLREPSKTDSTPQKRQWKVLENTSLPQNRTSKVSVIKKIKKEKSISPVLKHMPQRHSKLPRIMLRPMKKSKSSKRKLSVQNKSLELPRNEMRRLSSKGTNISKAFRNTSSLSLINVRRTSPIKTGTSKSKNNIANVSMPNKNSDLKIIALSTNPRVILKRLDLENCHVNLTKEYGKKQAKTSDSSKKLEPRKSSRIIFKNTSLNGSNKDESSTNEKNKDLAGAEEIKENNVNGVTKAQPITSSTPSKDSKLRLSTDKNLPTVDSPKDSRINETYEVIKPKTNFHKNKTSKENDNEMLSTDRFTSFISNKKNALNIKQRREERQQRKEILSNIKEKRLLDHDANRTNDSLISKGVKVHLRNNEITNRERSLRRTLESKNVVTGKIPNFMKIHQKMFAKSESLVDTVKRIQRKHAALRKTPIRVNKEKSGLTPLTFPLSLTSTSKPSRSSLHLPKTPYDATPRKLKKQDAVDIISRRVLPHSRNNQHERREEMRSSLKGVRTNRRFELQMKHRNIKF